MPQLFPPPHTQRRHFVTMVLIITTVLLSTFLVDYWRSLPQPGFDQIPPTTPTPQAPPCANTSASALQRCCQEWVQTHNLLTVQCVGEWYLESGSCAFRCETTPSNKAQTSSGSALPE